MKKKILIGIFIIFISIPSYFYFKLYSFVLRPVGKSTFYYSDPFGIIYGRNTDCGVILGGCNYSYYPLFGIPLNSLTILDPSGNCLDMYAKTNKNVYIRGEKQSQIRDSATFYIREGKAQDKYADYSLCDLHLVTLK